MFEKTLEQKFQRIFGMKSVRFTAPIPGEDVIEQETLFVDIQQSLNNVSPALKRQVSRVTGQILVHANVGKLPFGFFSKAIAAADPTDTADLFFFNFERSRPAFQSIDERGLNFVYLFNGQYDPDQGSLTSLQF